MLFCYAFKHGYAPTGVSRPGAWFSVACDPRAAAAPERPYTRGPELSPLNARPTARGYYFTKEGLPGAQWTTQGSQRRNLCVVVVPCGPHSGLPALSRQRPATDARPHPATRTEPFTLRPAYRSGLIRVACYLRYSFKPRAGTVWYWEGGSLESARVFAAHDGGVQGPRSEACSWETPCTSAFTSRLRGSTAGDVRQPERSGVAPSYGYQGWRGLGKMGVGAVA
jgi:hypothetical protein